MTSSSMIAIVATSIAAAVLLASLLLFIMDRRSHAPEQNASRDSIWPAFRDRHRNRLLVLLAGMGLIAGAIGYFTTLNNGLAFASGEVLVMVITVLAGAGGIGNRHCLAVVSEESEPWTRPSVSSLALGLMLASGAFLAVGLLVFKWPDPLILLNFALGALATAFVVRIGGSLMALSCNSSFDCIRDIITGLEKRVPQLASEPGYHALDHGGLAAEYAVLYICVMIMATGMGVLDKSSGHAVYASLVQIMAAASLVFGFILLVILRYWEGREKQAALLNRGILISAVLVLLTGLIAGYILLKTEAVDMLWPLLAAFVVLFVIAALLQYNTSRRYKTVQNVARQSTYGPAVLYLGGSSLGMGGMVLPLLLLALLAVLADSAGSGKSTGTACMVMAAGFLASLAPLLTPYYFADESRQCGNASESPVLQASEITTPPPRRPGTMTANLMGSMTFLTVGMTVMASLGLLLRLGKEGSIYAVSTFSVLAFFGGVVLAVGIQALLFSSTRAMMVDIIEIYRRPGRELAAGRQRWNNDIYYLHCSEVWMYNTVHPWFPLLLVAFGIALDVFLLGGETIIPMMLAFAATGLCFSLWLDISGGAWSSAFRFVDAGNFGDKGSDAYCLSQSMASVGLILRQIIVPAMRITLMLALFGSLLYMSGGWAL